MRSKSCAVCGCFSVRKGTLTERIRFLCRASRLVVDEIGYLPVTPGGGNLFFHLVNARYEKGTMILSSNLGFVEWGDIFGSPVVATALLDRLHHHAVVIQIEGSSYRMREHAALIPENLRANHAANLPTAPSDGDGRQQRSATITKPADHRNQTRRQNREFEKPTIRETLVPVDTGNDHRGDSYHARRLGANDRVYLG